MADKKITALAVLSDSEISLDDQIVVVDVSDTSMAPTGTTKRASVRAARYGVDAATTDEHLRRRGDVQVQRYRPG